MTTKILLFGDIIGIPQLLRHIPAVHIVGIVASGIRSEQHIPLSEIAQSLELPFLIQPKYKSDDYKNFVSHIEDLKPELILCNSYSLLLRSDILGIPEFGAVNIHGALLPAYRGS